MKKQKQISLKDLPTCKEYKWLAEWVGERMLYNWALAKRMGMTELEGMEYPDKWNKIVISKMNQELEKQATVVLKGS